MRKQIFSRSSHILCSHTRSLMLATSVLLSSTAMALGPAASAAPVSWLPTSLTAIQKDASATAPTILWLGKTVDPGTLPDAWNSTTTERVQELAQWIDTDKYSISISDDERVILLSPSGKQHTKRWKLVQHVLKDYDALVPAIEDRDLSKESFRTSTYGIGDHRPDSDPVVLIEAGDEGAYSQVVESLAKEHPYLISWSQAARAQPGFVESYTQTGAWMESPSGFELGKVWRGENELVHRLGSLLLFRSYGPMPHWFRTSVGWHLEQSVLGDIYHFPMRHEFVSVMEHSGWKTELKRAFKKGQPVGVEDFADWKRTEWSQPKAEIAWGMLAYIKVHKVEHLSKLAESFRKHHKENSILEEAGGRWSVITGYQIPPTEQAELIHRVMGPEVMVDAGSFFKSWKAPKKKKAKKKNKKSKSRS